MPGAQRRIASATDEEITIECSVGQDRSVVLDRSTEAIIGTQQLEGGGGCHQFQDRSGRHLPERVVGGNHATG